MKNPLKGEDPRSDRLGRVLKIIIDRTRRREVRSFPEIGKDRFDTAVATANSLHREHETEKQFRIDLSSFVCEPPINVHSTPNRVADPL